MARVWVLTSGKMGDDKQSLRLAAALDVPFEEKQIVFNDRARSWRLMLGPSRDSVDAEKSSPLEAPWPELVISTGWRQVPVVRWIKARSGGSTRLVQMNRPPGPKHFDLVLSPPQYSVPVRKNVVRLEWPLQLPPSPEALDQARVAWQERLGGYPHPWTVVLLGGESHPFSFGRDETRFLFDEALSRAKKASGSVLISTSRRTPEAALQMARQAESEAPERTFLYEWRPATDNPYVAFLEGGDEFVVTPDSISMLVEVARLGRPIAIAPHTQTRSLTKSMRNGLKSLLHGQLERPQSALAESISDLASFFGLKYVRTLDSVSTHMVDRGWAGNFPEFRGERGRPLPDEDFDRVVERVREMLVAGPARERV